MGVVTTDYDMRHRGGSRPRCSESFNEISPKSTDIARPILAFGMRGIPRPHSHAGLFGPSHQTAVDARGCITVLPTRGFGPVGPPL